MLSSILKDFTNLELPNKPYTNRCWVASKINTNMSIKSFQAKSSEDWRDWLKKNHLDEKEVWLIYYKKHTDKPTVGYLESVEEAICFGWIDGIIKRIDDEKYAHKFTVRQKKSKWSPTNISIAKKMIAEKKMTNSGLAFFKQRIEYDKEFTKARASKEIKLTPEIEQALRKNEQAWNNFMNLTPSNKKQYIEWLISAKKEVTKRKRLVEAINLLEKNQKLGMK